MAIKCIVPRKWYRVVSYDSLVGFIQIAKIKPDMFVTSPSVTNEWLWNARYVGANGCTTNKQISMLCNECHLARLVIPMHKLEALEIDYNYINKCIIEAK